MVCGSYVETNGPALPALIFPMSYMIAQIGNTLFAGPGIAMSATNYFTRV
jgi:hypothetical protein